MTERAARLRGVFLMLAAVGTFAVMDALMKQLTVNYPPVQVACLRGAASVPFVFLSYFLTGRLNQLVPVRFGLHLLRALFSVFMLWGFLWSLAHATMADTYAVFMSAPLLVVLVAVVLLREHAGIHVWLAIGTGLAGVLVMLRPSASGFVSLAGLAAFGSAIGYAFVVVMVRTMARTETTASMVFWFLLLLALGAGALAAPSWVPVAGRDFPWVLAVGIAGWGGQHLITEAFRHAPASAIAPYEYTGLVWAAVIDWLVWGALPGARLVAGAVIVVAAGLYLLHHQRRAVKR